MIMHIILGDKAVLNTISEFYPNKKNMVVFQPPFFTYAGFYGRVCRSTNQFDEIVLMEIYPAREKPILE